MSRSKKERDETRLALSLVDGGIFTEFGSIPPPSKGLPASLVDLRRCLDDLDDNEKERELAVKVAVIATDKLHAGRLKAKDKEIEALKAKIHYLNKRWEGANP